MKRTVINILIIAGFLLAVPLILSSCDTNLDLVDPSFQTPETFFENSDELLQATNAIYSQLAGGQLFGREWFFVHDLRSDEVASGGGQLEGPRAQILNGNTSPTNSLVNDVWNGLYNIINRANLVVHNGPRIEDNPELRERLIGEAKFLRAWAYYELVTLWGPVPVYLEPIESPDEFQPRIPEEEVYARIITDLEEAAEVLPQTYPDADRGRATWGAAKAMLGRVYMQQLDFESAKTHLQEIIASGLYSLIDNYSDNFLEETEFNEESIFEVIFTHNTNNFNWGLTGDGPTAPLTTVRNQEYNPVAWRNLIPSNAYLNNFQHTITGFPKTDPRLGMSVYMTGDTFNNGQTELTADMQNGNTSQFHGETMKISWRKYTLIYKQSVGESDFYLGGNNHRMIRYAEVLLNMAEAENETGNIQAALDYMNHQVRARPSVDMPPYPTEQYPANNKMDVVEIIMHERMAELGSEGIRNRDLLRWRQLGYIGGDNEPFGYFQPGRDELLPIPLVEIDNNPELGSAGISPQNPGY